MASEREPDSSDWIECGGEFMMAMGFTEGGAPYGLTADEFRQMNEREDRSAGWARAKRALRSAFEGAYPGAHVEIGYVKRLGEGLSRDVFAARIDLSPDPGQRSGGYVVLVPRRHADRELGERTDREALLLARLARLRPPFRIPDVVGVVADGAHRLLVRRFVQGIDLDFRAGRLPGVRPWEIVGKLAASVHALNTRSLVDVLPGYPSRREHARAEVGDAFARLNGDDVADQARAWALDHLPPDVPAVLLHGDLLGQNILLAPETAPALIDWEYAQRGDPAYDLAIVTRGVRQPFQVERGLDKLLDAYTEHGGRPLERTEVVVHELCLAARWYRDSLEGVGRHPPEQSRNFLRGILRRALAT